MLLFRLGLLAALSVSAPALAQEQEPPRSPTIVMTGSGEVELKPDFARIHVAAETRAKTVAQAVDANRTASERVLARLQAIGVKREDIQTANFQVFRVEEPSEPGPRGERSAAVEFVARHQLRLTTRDLSEIGRLTGELMASGDMTFQSIAWGLDRPQEAGDEARKAAVRDARRQAEVYAEAAGAKLGRLREIRDASARAYGSEESDMPLKMSMARAAPALPIMPPAVVRYGANVQMVWDLER
jgi:uncharacterized protein YggE